MWFYFSLISAAMLGLNSVALKKCSNNEQRRTVPMGLLFYNGALLIFSVIVHPEFISRLCLEDLLYVLPGIAAQCSGFACRVSATKYGLVSITVPIQKTKVVIPFLLGILVLHEKCSLLQIAVSAMLVALSILVAHDRHAGKPGNADKSLQRKAVWFSYGFVLCNGTSTFLNKVYVTHFQEPMYTLFMYGLVIVTAVAGYCLLTGQKDCLDFRKLNNKGYFALQSSLDASASVFDRIALMTGDVSVISIISSSGIVITTLASRWLLKERISWQKYAMIFGMFLCILMLAVIK